jgi:hypothetical protein
MARGENPRVQKNAANANNGANGEAARIYTEDMVSIFGQYYVMNE